MTEAYGFSEINRGPKKARLSEYVVDYRGPWVHARLGFSVPRRRVATTQTVNRRSLNPVVIVGALALFMASRHFR